MIINLLRGVRVILNMFDVIQLLEDDIKVFKYLYFDFVENLVTNVIVLE